MIGKNDIAIRDDRLIFLQTSIIDTFAQYSLFCFSANTIFVVEVNIVGIFVVGGKSSNAKVLYQHCVEANPRTIFVSSPEELEERLLSLPGIREAVVTGNGETREIVAEIYGVTSQSSMLHAVGQLNAQLPVYMRIKRTIVRREPFPRTSSGKIRV